MVALETGNETAREKGGRGKDGRRREGSSTVPGVDLRPTLDKQNIATGCSCGADQNITSHLTIRNEQEILVRCSSLDLSLAIMSDRARKS